MPRIRQFVSPGASGSLAILGITLLAACGGGGGTPPASPVTPPTPPAPIIVVTATPVITAPPLVTAGQPGYTASVSHPVAGTAYAWSITGGTLPGIPGATVSFTPGASGTVGLSVVATAQGASASLPGTAACTIVAPPTITRFTASPGSIVAGASDSLTGVFANGTGVITPGTLPLASSTALQVSPAATTSYTLTVTNPAGTAVTSNATVTVNPASPVLPAPTVTGLNPASGVVGTAVTLAGTGLAGATAVSFNGTAAPFTLVNATTVTATVPAGASTGPVLVATPQGNATSATFTVPLPTITGFTPPSGAAGTVVTLNGTHFQGATAVRFNGLAAAFSVTSDSQVTATVPANPTPGSITVTAPDGIATSTRFVAGSLGLLAGAPSGIGNVPGNGADPTTARFYLPTGVAIDGSGNICVADGNNHVVRLITPSGVVRVLAGTLDVPGDPAVDPAYLNDPVAVAVDGAGDVFVADAGTGSNGRICWIPSGGALQVLSTQYLKPLALAVDSGATVVYVADASAGAVSCFPMASPTAGAPIAASGLGNPAGLAVDSSGNVFVADSLRNVIYRIAPISASGFPYAYDPAGAPVLLAGVLDTAGFADGAPGTLHNPQGVALNGAGTYLYVADASNQEIRVVDTASGALTTLAGSPLNSGSTDGQGPSARFDFPTGVAVVPTAGTYPPGNLLVADNGNNTIREIPVTSAAPPAAAASTSTLAGKAGTPAGESSNGFDEPTGVAVDSAGNIYVADASNNVIGLIAAGGTSITTLAGTGGIAPASAAPVAAAAATFHAPSRVVVDNHPGNATFGTVYVADTGNDSIRAIHGGLVTSLGQGGHFNTPLGIALDLAGNVYVANTNDNNLQELMAPDFTTITVIGGDPGTSGNGYVGAAGSTGDGGPATAALFNQPWGVAVDTSALASAGTLYVADSSNNKIRSISTGGIVTTLAGSNAAGFADGTGATAQFNHPDDLVVDPATGYLYVADTFNQAIRLIVPGANPAATTVVTLVGLGGWGILPAAYPAALPATLAFPFGLALDPLTGVLLLAVHDALLTAPY